MLRGWSNADCEFCGIQYERDDPAAFEERRNLIDSGVAFLINGSGRRSFPKLISVVLDIQGCAFNIHAVQSCIGALLRLKTIRASVGRWTFPENVPVGVPCIEIVHAPLLQAWSYYRDLPMGHNNLARGAPKELKHLPSDFAQAIREVWRVLSREKEAQAFEWRITLGSWIRPCRAWCISRLPRRRKAISGYRTRDCHLA